MSLAAIYCKIIVTRVHVGTSGNTSEDHFFSKDDSECLNYYAKDFARYRHQLD